MDDSNRASDSGVARTLALAGSSGRRRRIRFWLAGAVLIVGAAYAVFQGYSGGSEIQVHYKTEAARRGNLTVTVTATGNLTPTNQVEVGSELSGIVKHVNVDFNDHVKVGQALAVLDTSKLKAKVLQSRAVLASANARVLSARATIQETRNQLARLQQVRRISGSKAVSQHDLDAAMGSLDRALAEKAVAEAAVEQARAVLESDETDLSKATIVSPINGIVLSRDVDPGQTVAASLQAPVLFVLAEDLAQMELHVDVDEAEVGKVKAGQEASFTVDAYPGRRFPAHITQVRYGAKTVEGVVTYATVLNVNNADLSLRPGMTATADITVQKIEDALLIPNAALRFSPPTAERKERSRGRGLIGSLFSPPSRPEKKPRTTESNGSKRRRIWTLRNGGLIPVDITIGPTDGTHTVVTGGDIQANTQCVVDMATAKATP